MSMSKAMSEGLEKKEQWNRVDVSGHTDNPSKQDKSMQAFFELKKSLSGIEFYYIQVNANLLRALSWGW